MTQPRVENVFCRNGEYWARWTDGLVMHRDRFIMGMRND